MNWSDEVIAIVEVKIPQFPELKQTKVEYLEIQKLPLDENHWPEHFEDVAEIEAQNIC